MDIKALLLVITVSVCCYYGTKGSSVCEFVEPFGGKVFAGVSRFQCRQFCLDADKFQCKSFMYNSIERDCILSETERTTPPSASGYNNYQYFQRPANCNPVSLIDKITSCSASSQYSADYPCEDSYDGSELVGASEWAMESGKGKGEWMQVNLNDTYVLTSIEILPRCNRQSQFSYMKVHLGPGEVIEVSRTCGVTDLWNDCSGPGNAWFPVVFPRAISTAYVKFEVIGVCDPAKWAIGIREIKLFGLKN